MATPLRQLGENALLQRLLQQVQPSAGKAPLTIGPGDDCAVVPRDSQWDTLLKTDVVVEGVHFPPDTEPERIGRKALARTVSDVAAMGGLPEYALITLLAHPTRPVEALEGVYRGMDKLAAAYGIALAGGETSSLPYDGCVINVALVGRVERGQAILRSTGKPGDVLFVSGPLGGSFPSGRHLDFEPRVQLARSLLLNGPRPTAMMDLSDGLGADLPRMAAACHCSFVLDKDSLPCHAGCSIQQAINDGEDYELLMAFSPADAARLRSGRCGKLYPIGSLCALGSPCGTPLEGGWRHFA